MFRSIALASLSTLGLLAPSTAQAQIVVRFPTPHHHHAHYLPYPTYLPSVQYLASYQVQTRTTLSEERAFRDLYSARRFETLKLAEGYDVEMIRLGLDWLVRYRLVTWQTYRTAYSLREADDLQIWLQNRGYQVRVVPS